MVGEVVVYVGWERLRDNMVDGFWEVHSKEVGRVGEWWRGGGRGTDVEV